MPDYKLYYMLLGCTPRGRNTEQHDVFFCIEKNLKDCIPHIKKFWKGAGKIHIDCWREVTEVDGYSISIHTKDNARINNKHLFFINLGGYLPGNFEEPHHKLLCVTETIAGAITKAKQTNFYKDYTIRATNAISHVDNKYGVDVDEILNVQDILLIEQKEKFSIAITPAHDMQPDEWHIGYLKLSNIMD